MSILSTRKDREERLAKLRDEARNHYEMSVICLRAGKTGAASHFQQEAAEVYERASNVLLGLMRKPTAGFGSTE